MRPPHLLSVIVFLLLVSAHAAAAGRVGIAATVGGQDISETELQNALNNHLRQQGVEVGAIRQPNKFKEIRARVLEVLIGQELLWQAAVNSDTVVTDAEVTQAFERFRAQFADELAFDNKIKASGYTQSMFRENLGQRLSVQKWIQANVKVSVDEAEVSRFYAENRQQFATPGQVRARHILIQLNSSSSETEKTHARKLLAELKQRAEAGEDFAALASEHSQDGSAAQGGDLGYFAPGQMVKPFEQAAFALSPGEVSAIVETRFGLHLIQLVDKKAPAFSDQQEVAGRIRDYLFQQRHQAAVQAAVNELKQQADIEIHNL